MATGPGGIAVSGPGAPIAAVVMGMMPGKLNEGEQDYFNRTLLEQLREAPTRVRYTREQDDRGYLTPHGWHTSEATNSPAPEEKNFSDYILILPFPDIPPIYVYLSQGRSGIPDKDHDYHPAPETSEIGISGLREAKKKTPKQGGGGLRERWVDAKGRRIYEWDSQHGELEEYRASDGEHLGTP